MASLSVVEEKEWEKGKGQKSEMKREGTGCLSGNANLGSKPGRLLLPSNPATTAHE